jgi:acyl-CoA synthetase (NDP forming)
MAVENLDELMGVVQCFYHLEDRPVRNLLVMGGGGGLGAQAADLAEESGLSLPPLSPETEARLREFFPDVGAVVANPLDVGIPLPPPPLFKLALDHLLVDPAFDLLIYDLAINFGVRLFGEEGVREAFRYLVSACRKMGKPCAVNLYNRAPDSLEITRLHLEVKEMLYEAGIPVYDNMALLMRSLAALSRWQQARG